MAVNPNNLPLYRSRMRTPLYGARFGLDDDGMIVGPGEIKLGVTTASSLSNIAAHGLTVLNAAAASTYVIDSPIPGVRKLLFCTVGTSIAVKSALGAAENFISTLGSTPVRLTFQSTGDFAMLVGLSTSDWGVMSVGAGVSMTTTT